MAKFDHSLTDEKHIVFQHVELTSIGLSRCRCGSQIDPFDTSVKCLYCAEWFCLTCAEDHFGETRQGWKDNH